MPPQSHMRIQHLDGPTMRQRRETLAGEEPFEVRILAQGQRRSAGVTMRTPGDDYELAAGMLRTQQLIASHSDIRQIAYCADTTEEQRYNIVTVELRGAMPALPDRRFSAGSACGICGVAAISAIGAHITRALAATRVAPATLYQLPARMRAAQGIFEHTGGLHAAALFSHTGELLALREDIGRHNAVDKLIGWALLQRQDVTQSIMLVSGRAGFEIVEKALVVGIPILCSISAPSSLAVSLARAHHQTLVGFLRGEQANVYAGEDRIVQIEKEHS